MTTKLAGAFALGACVLMGPLSASAGVVQAVEFYHAGFDHYFMTASPAEASVLDAGVQIKGWTRTGQQFSVSDSGLSPVCRFFSTSFAPKSSHFYTANGAECSTVKSNPNWAHEGTAFNVNPAAANGTCSSGSKVYRLYNSGQGGAPNHRYTTDPATVNAMKAKGWVPEGAGEGVAFCTSTSAPPASTAFTKTNALLGGTWIITYKYGAPTYTDTVKMTTISATTSLVVPYFAQGRNKSGRDAYGGWGTNTNELMVISELSASADDVYVFDYTGANSIAGCYYFDYGQSNPFSSPCTPLTGVRSSSAITLAEDLLDERQAKIDHIITQKAVVNVNAEASLEQLRSLKR